MGRVCCCSLVPLSRRCLFIHAWSDHRQLSDKLQIDPSRMLLLVPRLAKTKQAASFFVPHRRDWIEFTRVRDIALRSTSRIAILEISCGKSFSFYSGTLERLLYIYYWSAMPRESEANNGCKIERRSLFRTMHVTTVWNLDIISDLCYSGRAMIISRCVHAVI